jgi:hypothetical protein
MTKYTNINHNDDPDLTFTDRKKGDRRTKHTKSNGQFFKRKVGDRMMGGVERRKSDDRRNDVEVIDLTGTTLWTSDDTEFDITVPRDGRWGQ